MDVFGNDWKNFTQEELNHQYSPSRWSDRLSPDAIVNNHIEVSDRETNKARESISCKELSYSNESTRTKLDLYGIQELPSNAPVLIYIHGGYWQDLSKSGSGIMSKWLKEEGICLAAVGYDLAPKATMHVIVEQIIKAVTMVMNTAVKNKSSVFVCGHSAGGHLASMTSAVEWSKVIPDYNQNYKGCILISGIFDLRPLVKTYVNEPLKMTESIAWTNSPASLIEQIATSNGKIKQLVPVGSKESPEFKRQSLRYSQLLSDKGVDCEYLEVTGVDHFDIIENLCDKDNQLSKRILDFIKS